jgi:hypothetical protein
VEAMERELAGGLEADAAVGARDHRYGPRCQAVPPSLLGLVGESPEEGDLAAALLAPPPSLSSPSLALASVGKCHPAQ